MKLEWFRTHKNFVYWVLLPVVGGTMAFFGIGSMGGGSVFGRPSPRVMYKLARNDRTVGEHYVSSSEVMNYRLLLTKFIGPRARDVLTIDVGHYLYGVAQAKAAGFEIGSEEMKERLRDVVKGQLRSREPSTTPVATEEIYDKLLSEMKMSAPDFEQLTHDSEISQKFNRFEMSVQVSDAELYAEYCRDKETVRLRYKVFKSADYMDKTTPAGDERIKEFYNQNKDKKIDMKDVLYTEAKLSAEVLAIDGDKYLAGLKPTEKDLTDMYERMKPIKYRAVVKANDPPPKEPFKPFAEVKGEVEKDWRDERKLQISGELSKVQQELEKAQKDYAELDKAMYPNRKDSERKPFDTADWVKKKADYLVYWTTDELTEEQYTKGKKELNAKDAEWVKTIFEYARPRPNMGRDPAQQHMIEEFYKKQFESFSYSTAIDPARPEKGSVIARKLKFTDMGLKSIEDSKAAIIQRLKVLDAVDLAQKDAKQAREDWDANKNLPNLDSLDEFKADSTNHFKNPLANSYFASHDPASPKPVGEVLPVGEMPPESTPENPRKEPYDNFYTGFAVEIQLPKVSEFERDTQWERDQHRRDMEQSYAQFLAGTMFEEVKGAVWKIPSDMADPPLNDAYGRGD